MFAVSQFEPCCFLFLFHRISHGRNIVMLSRTQKSQPVASRSIDVHRCSSPIWVAQQGAPRMTLERHGPIAGDERIIRMGHDLPWLKMASMAMLNSQRRYLYIPSGKLTVCY